MDMFQYQYSPKNLVITCGDTVFEVQDGSVTYLYISHDYLQRRHPWIRINIELHSTVIATIYDHIDEAMLKFDLYEYQKNQSGNIVNTSLYFQHSFTMIPTKVKSAYITSDDSVTVDYVDEMRSLQLFDTYLIDSTAVNWFTKELSTVFHEATLPAILQALLEMRDVPAGITIATAPENYDILDYVIMPLGDLIGNITYLNNHYGLYPAIPFVYYDLLNLYCINKVNPNITLTTAGEYSNVTILLYNANDPDSQSTGSLTDIATATHYINIKEEPEITDLTKMRESTKFATITAVDKEGNVEKRTLSEEGTALQYVYARNDMTVDQVINESYTGHAVNILAENTCVSFLKPYKSVTFTVGSQYENLGLTGHQYRITGWSVSIMRESTGTNAVYIHDSTINMIRPAEHNPDGTLVEV